MNELFAENYELRARLADVEASEARLAKLVDIVLHGSGKDPTPFYVDWDTWYQNAQKTIADRPKGA